MFVLSFQILIGRKAEYRRDPEIMLQPFKGVIVANQRRYGGSGKDGGILSVSGFILVMLDNMLCHQLNPLFCHKDFITVNILYQRIVLFIVLPLIGGNILHAEAQNILIKDRLFNQIGMQAFSENIRGCPVILTFVFCHSRCSRKSKELPFCKVLFNGFVHIAKLSTMAFINDENHFFVPILLHDLGIPRTAKRPCHFLYGGDNQFFVLIGNLFDQNIGFVCRIYTIGLKFVKLLRSLIVQVFSVCKKKDLFNSRFLNQ